MTKPSPDSDWQAIRAVLEARRSEINAEISAYPAPITGCDAQFNHLTEQRSALNRELARLEEARGRDEPETFVASCPFLDREEVRQ